MGETILSKRLKQIREKKDLTLLQVQQHAGINFKTLGGYEVGKSKPDPETMAKLAKFYDVSTDWLLGNTNNPNSHLSKEQRDAVQKLNLDDDSFLDLPFYANGRELTRQEKIKLRSVAALLLDKDR